MASGGKVTVKIDGDTNGFKKKFDNLKGYADTLLQVKERSNIPAEFFAQLRVSFVYCGGIKDF